jgi:uncharacterized protein YkwD
MDRTTSSAAITACDTFTRLPARRDATLTAMNTFERPGRLTALGLASVLAACGGGSDSAAADIPAPTPVEVVADPTGNCGVANVVNDTLAQVNAFRAEARTCGKTSYPAVGPLAWNQKLAQAAHAHSADMAAHNYFDHVSRDGRTFDQRITAAGYAWSSAAENLAAGPTTTTAAMAGWQASEGHCANLMRASVTEVGLSCVKGAPGAAYGTYWTMALARPR